ncbi:MAG: FAD-binding oxidoreductase [Acidobacteria bacterium]|nr:FAD-binding oxidoreductase [Acidobacteriota bacterium]
MHVNSWGRYPAPPQTVFCPAIPTSPLKLEGPFLPRGLGRSYGDSCLSPGTLVDITGWKCFLDWDPETGVVRVESGVSLQQIIDVLGPRGWLPSVLPGTSQVTVGGAIANDIHGKNHHRAGTFGCHVLQFEILHSDGRRSLCSPEKNPDLFAATIGGLGLTGTITWADIQLRRISGPLLDCETLKFKDLSAFFNLCDQSDRDFEYTVAWLDTAGRGQQLGRGHFIRANHSPASKQWPKIGPALQVPFQWPNWTLNRFSMSVFNWCYYHRQISRAKSSQPHLNAFFFPLDRVGNWNLIYGSRGFVQYQCVTPNPQTIEKILLSAGAKGKISFLSVLKRFGSRQSPGLLSFPKPGYTLAMDFPVTRDLFPLLESWDEWVMADEGRIYPAKDARMSPSTFNRQFPELAAFGRWVDPQIRSYLWQRLMEEK